MQYMIFNNLQTFYKRLTQSIVPILVDCFIVFFYTPSRT